LLVVFITFFVSKMCRGAVNETFVMRNIKLVAESLAVRVLQHSSSISASNINGFLEGCFCY